MKKSYIVAVLAIVILLGIAFVYKNQATKLVAPITGSETSTSGIQTNLTDGSGIQITATQGDGEKGSLVVESVALDGTKTTMDQNSVLIKEIIKKGTGAAAKKGDVVSVHYVGVFTNGTKFDSSRDRGTPFEFTLGAGQVIKGWDQGVEGMEVGEVRKLTVPSSLGYGPDDYYSIPGGSTLIFEVELLAIK